MNKKEKILNVVKSIGFWMIILLFFEVSFRIIMHYSFNLESIINIVLYSIIIGAFFCFCFQNLKSKKAKIIFGIILFVLAFLFSLQCIFFKIFKTYFSLSSLKLGDQVGDFKDQAINQIFVKNGLYMVLYLIPFVLFCIFGRKLKIERNTKFENISFLAIGVIGVLLLILNINLSKGKTNGSYDLRYKVNNVALNNERFGVLNSYRIDFLRYQFGFKEELVKEVKALDAEIIETKENEEEPIVYELNVKDLDLEKDTWNEEIISINEYIRDDTPTLRNQYTGMFEGYNLIYITAESFYGAAIREDLTPTLYKMVNEGFVFENFYTPNILSTIGGEFQTLTGLYPSKDILSKWREETNYFGLGNVFGDMGYTEFAYHNHYYGFQDRNKYLRSQGFDTFIAIATGMEQRINSRIWPESDVEMMEATISDYIDSESPFLAYYMTVSGHMDYNFDGDNCMCLKNKDEVTDFEGTTAARAYAATLVELDRALEVLINQLSEAGKLDNTVFVMAADHYPYALDIEDINSMSSYERDEVVEINHNNLIIWNSQMEPVKVEKACMAVDILPTVYNLFGIEYDSRLFTGRDILSTSGGIAIMDNQSWVSDKGTYFSLTDEFVPKEGAQVSEDYVENVNNIVRNRINIAKWIVKNDYYNFLFN